MDNHILIIDDEKVLTVLLKRTLELEGFKVDISHNLKSAQKALDNLLPDLLILDLNLPDGNGLEFYRSLRKEDIHIPTLMITAFASIESAIQATREGVDDYIVKPFDPKQIIQLIQALMDRFKLHNQLNYYRNKISCDCDANFFVSALPEMEELQKLGLKIASVENSTVLISGPTGCGKEMFARFIHSNAGTKETPFIDINCAGLSDTLLESELFGHEPGAFTDAKKRKQGLVELAGGGTLFLDEIGEMSLNLQAKILRFIETRTFRRLGGISDLKVDTRIIAATNRDMTKMVAQGTFREDLYYRLNLFEIKLPALKERRGELPLMAQFFLEKISIRLKKSVLHLSAPALQALESYTWPGNLRELYNVLERAVILCNSDTLEPELFPEQIRNPQNGTTTFAPRLHDLKGQSLKDYLGFIEKKLLQEALNKNRGNQQKAARDLNEPRHVIRYMMQRHNLL